MVPGGRISLGAVREKIFNDVSGKNEAHGAVPMEEIERIYRPIDHDATRTPIASGLLPCLYIPIGARSTDAIETYVGKIALQLAPRSPGMALLVEAYLPDKADDRLAIWDVPEAGILHHPSQVWVHVDYRAYRRAYIRAFPDANLTGFVLDHILNRRVARLKGFTYVRIVPISRGANSSHGALSEGWSVDHHSTPSMREKNRLSQAAVQYADLSDITKMLNIQGGGSYMDNVNEAQKLVDLPDENGIRRLSATLPPAINQR